MSKLLGDAYKNILNQANKILISLLWSFIMGGVMTLLQW